MNKRMRIVIVFLFALLVSVLGCSKKNTSAAIQPRVAHHLFITDGGFIHVVGDKEGKMLTSSQMLGAEQIRKYQADNARISHFFVINGEYTAVAETSAGIALIITSTDVKTWSVSGSVAIGSKSNVRDFMVCNDGTKIILTDDRVSILSARNGLGGFSVPANNQGSSDRRIVCGNDLAIFLQAESPRIIMSRQGGPGEPKTLPIPKDTYIEDIAAGNGVLVAVGMNREHASDPTPVELISTDAENWVSATAPDNMKSVDSIVFGNGKFVALGRIGDQDVHVATSSDGRLWRPVEVKGLKPGDRLSFNGDYFTVESSNRIIRISYDAISWGYFIADNLRSPACFEDYDTCFKPKPTPVATVDEDPRITTLKNLSYKIPDLGDVQLQNGKAQKTVEGSEIPVEFDNRDGRIAFGDLGGGSGQDAVVVVGNGGGSHWQSYLALVLKTGGAYKNTSTVWPGLAAVETISIIPDGKIEVTGPSYGPNDPACCPTQKATVVYAVKNDVLYAVSGNADYPQVQRQSAQGESTQRTSPELARGQSGSDDETRLCSINPQACEAKRRNNEIRATVMEQKCQYIRNAMAGVQPAIADYQLRKAGCR
jgi:hypothetical protein